MSKLFKVMLDPGHGGSEPGAVNQYTREADINLTVAKACKAYIEKSYTEFHVELTRHQDVTLDLFTRAGISNAFGADLFYSFHHNAGGGDGFEVYHYENSIHGIRAANLLAAEFKALGQNMRFVGSGMKAGSEQGNYTVLELTECPALLGEFGFMDTKDYTQFDEHSELVAIGHAYARSILKFFNYEILPEGSNKEGQSIILPTIEERVSKVETAILELSQSQMVINNLMKIPTIAEIITALRTIK